MGSLSGGMWRETVAGSGSFPIGFVRQGRGIDRVPSRGVTGAGSYRADRGSVRTWILSIVHNRGIDQLRSLASRRRTQDKVEASAPRFQPSDAFSEAWRNSQRDQVREALGTLPPEQLKILELAYFSGYTHVEISELLDVPLGTVKGRMRLGLKKIKNYFDSEDMVMFSYVPTPGRYT